ncbi:hypothetical protein RJ639_029179 [Escallonia herrerae]|uniref:Uncharacterized protein n=1 Tax=Escallonia herrerae TaxID=1293975 RepID=A0AA88XKY8_9ASTE|nr:hypothetical protein RJ639_029179 [Escallonia herrerae]
MEEDGLRTRSFRNEDYNNRRVFLRSYPLQWGGEDEESKEDTAGVTTKGVDRKEPTKKTTRSAFRLGGGERKEEAGGAAKGGDARERIMNKILSLFHLREEDEDGKAGEGKKPIKKIILLVFEWGEGRVLIFKRFKHKRNVWNLFGKFPTSRGTDEGGVAWWSKDSECMVIPGVGV